MRRLGLCCIAILIPPMGGEVASAQVSSTQSFVTSLPEAGQRYPTAIQLSETQRRGMRLGAQVGMLAGVGIAWVAWTPDDDDECPNFHCIGKGIALPFYLVGGMLGGVVAGGAVGLGVATIVDDDGGRRAALEVRVRLTP
jgi:hypothetical protein